MAKLFGRDGSGFVQFAAVRRLVSLAVRRAKIVDLDRAAERVLARQHQAQSMSNAVSAAVILTPVADGKLTHWLGWFPRCGGGRMVGVEAALEIRVLHRHGKSIREIARETGVARNTVRRYLRDEGAARYKPRPPRSTKLDPFRAYVIERAGLGGAGIDTGERAADGVARARLLRRLHNVEQFVA